MPKASRRNRQKTTKQEGMNDLKILCDNIKDEDKEQFVYYFEVGVEVTKKIKKLKPLVDNRPDGLTYNSLQEKRSVYKKMSLIYSYDFSKIALEEVNSILKTLDTRNIYSNLEKELYVNDFNRYLLLSIVYNHLSNSNYVKSKESLEKYKEVSSKNLDIMLFEDDTKYKDIVGVNQETQEKISFGSSELVRGLGQEQMENKKCLKECWEAIFQEEMP